MPVCCQRQQANLLADTRLALHAACFLDCWHNCTQQPDLSQLQLDDKLEAVFGTKQLAAAALPQALGTLLQPLEAVTVTHTIS
jgi:hypothetical protein